MASAGAKVGVLSLIVPVIAPATVASMGYVAYKIDWKTVIKVYFSGPGRLKRIAALLFVLFNLKNMPFAWTVRVFYAIFYNSFVRICPKLPTRSLFMPMITPNSSPILEMDYNWHKSNSTYFSDLDVSRSHLVSYLCRPALKNLSMNAKTRLVLDPATDKPVTGPLGIILGAVHCSFKKEIPIYKGYEVWSKILSWDRKWFYIVSHFVPKGTAKPIEWLEPGFGKKGLRKPGEEKSKEDWEKKIHASAVSKYVYKLGRWTVHPSIVLGDSGLLPERPGGWRGGPNGLGEEADLLDGEGYGEEWDWKKVERQRRLGMEYALHFLALDGLQDLFDGGNNGALKTVGPG